LPRNFYVVITTIKLSFQQDLKMTRFATLSCLAMFLLSLNTFDLKAEEPEAEISAKPVEPDMHEFMEYVFQPTYKRLKVQMATEQKENSNWKAIKSDALILSESGNLLLMRNPETDEATWRKLSADVRDLGEKLYRSAKSKDEDATQTHYKAMLIKCNACHKSFADGKYQLLP